MGRSDPAGLWFETTWDAASLVAGAGNLGDSVGRGDVLGTIADSVGLIVDTAAALIPVVPGGVGNLRKVSKLARTLSEIDDASKPIKLTRSLRKNMSKCGTKFGPGDDAAHIVAKGDRRHSELREALAGLGLDINDPINGVKVDRGIHQGSHTNEIMGAIEDSIFGARDIEDFLDRMKSAGDIIRRGRN